MNRLWVIWVLFAAVSLGCSNHKAGQEVPSWAWAAHSEAAALLSVHGTSGEDVWMAGADDGQGPLVLHFDGSAWERRVTGVSGDIWWVHATAEGPVFLGGSGSLLLRYEAGKFERLVTPGLGKHTIFGVSAASSEDVYAVGAAAGRNGFIWHFDGVKVVEVPLPQTVPQDAHHDVPGMFKVWVASPKDVWVVGAHGVVLRGNATDGFSLVQSGGEEILFTVHGSGEHVAIVGGTGQGQVLESRGEGLENHTPEAAPLLQGVFVQPNGVSWAVGAGGSIFRGFDGKYEAVDPELAFAAGESLHAVWVDPSGGVWAVGGDVLTPELDQGLALSTRPGVPEFKLEKPVPGAPSCPEAVVDPHPNGSIARRWDEQLLNAIRRDVPRPGVHARNLFHTSIAFWDAFAAYDAQADGVLTHERLQAPDISLARTEAISYAAYRVLSQRYAKAVGGGVSQACFDAFMAKLGFDPKDTTEVGTSPRALGNRIGSTILQTFANDGANEANNYADPAGFVPDTPNLVVDQPGTTTESPLLWQRLVLAKAETQNGIPSDAGAQGYIGGQWGTVTPFALVRPAPNMPYLDLGTAPLALDDTLVADTVDVIRRSSELDAEDATMIDISPGALGNNALGTNDGHGYAENPITHTPYASQPVRRSDFGRVLAEFWADGPTSETPPGHWNTIANDVADNPQFKRQLFGAGEALDALTWDVHTYLALNAAVHDAGIAAWELKRKYLTARPITLIRYMGGKGQRTDATGLSYSPEGLPLVPDLIEVITEASSMPGQRHAHLSRYVGEVAVRAWRGEPGDRKQEVGGVGWLRAVEWTPYQRRTFVTPAFPGYISGHSTFSRAAATVLSELTGSAYFPGGLGSYTFAPGYLFFEKGPTASIKLQWATYFDAADQAGQSRIWGGIHSAPDDFDGRKVGAVVGAKSLALAKTYFDGSAVP
ncbi:MAG: vanadium-dependent haloperoxidase [Polyangiaceae bacterium]|nr:vanadium-dependent haloperoxidase [Polyangiaceae bacterium]